jgi:(2Fe-2S) ferredoxin
VDVQIDEGMTHDQLPLEDFTGTSDERIAEIKSRLIQAMEGTLGYEKKALIIYNSHMGGHKFAGNVIVSLGSPCIRTRSDQNAQIYTPSASGIWYGRVSTHEVKSIVENTIIGGKILPPLLRGGVNLQRPHGASLNDW